ncbi:MAG: hypothetical protein EA425_05935 [Puniceicoccaceae bacterium]|nr:MAG: hypothetical protein EA425_05935 [Puniceicoccaceae bacterium]
MKTFYCQRCEERLFFENTTCLTCGSTLGFLPRPGLVVVIEPTGDGTWTSPAPEATGKRLRQCRNYHEESVCNWMLEEGENGAGFCLACALNRTIPDLNHGNHWELWAKIEGAKRRLVNTLIRLDLPLVPKSVDPDHGLAFDFLADPSAEYFEKRSVLTGHKNGVITINIAEADDAIREKMRLNLREVYRTVLGHFRHESGHYYWDRLVRDDPAIGEVRAVFGDEREDYASALERHYASGPPADWQAGYVTPYASAHPWEDWAETWAHYLHIMDTLETAASNGLEIRTAHHHRFLRNPFECDFTAIREDWLALRFVLNSLNRSMGMPDPYPFVVSDAVAAKLEFIHRWIRR